MRISETIKMGTDITEVSQPLLFNYDSLDAETRTFVQEKARAIHTRLKRTAEDIIAIGQDLIEVKARLGHGKFLPWLQSEFEMTDRHALNFMRVASRFGSKSEIISDLPVTVIYELAAPSTPDTVIEMVTTGQVAPTLPAIREVKQEIQALPLAPDPEPTSHFMQLMSSSETPEWYTPAPIVERVVNLFGEIGLDPCSNSHDRPNVPAKIHYTKEDDGLSKPWHSKVYMNPPYGDEIPRWVRKLLEEYASGRVEEAVALVPGRLDTTWFQPLYEHPMCNIRGRLKFIGAPHSAPFPSVAVYLGRRQDAFIEAFKDLGPIMGRAETEITEERDEPEEESFFAASTKLIETVTKRDFLRLDTEEEDEQEHRLAKKVFDLFDKEFEEATTIEELKALHDRCFELQNIYAERGLRLSRIIGKLAQELEQKELR